VLRKSLPLHSSLPLLSREQQRLLRRQLQLRRLLLRRL
jgi:hypothetical protein